jgi:hypothetical protein
MYASKAFKSSALCACRFLANCAFQLAASLFSEVFSGVVSSESEPAVHWGQQEVHAWWSYISHSCTHNNRESCVVQLWQCLATVDFAAST